MGFFEQREGEVGVMVLHKLGTKSKTMYSEK